MGIHYLEVKISDTALDIQCYKRKLQDWLGMGGEGSTGDSFSSWLVITILNKNKTMKSEQQGI